MFSGITAASKPELDVAQKAEAKRRMGVLFAKGLEDQVYWDYVNSEKRYISERCIFASGTTIEFVMGRLMDVDEATQSLIDEVEAKFDCLVYHATKERTEFGEIMDFFFVSKYEEEWESDYRSLQEGYAFVYAYNLSEPLYSDLGTIKWETAMGGLLRTA